jgi:diguanylate cyclase (GGDEF)-like protein
MGLAMLDAVLPLGRRLISATAALGCRLRQYRRTASSDLLLISLACLATYITASCFDTYEQLHQFVMTHEDWQADELLTAAFISPFGLAIYAARRTRQLRQEVSRRRRAEDEAQRLAVHDALTGLPNRRRLGEAMDRGIAQRSPGQGSLALFLIDLDRFKSVNDLYGHQAGDRLLQLVGERLAGIARDSDTVARLGGDEFALLAPCADDPQHAARTAARIIASLQASFDLDGIEAQVGASVGVAIAPQDGATAELLHRRADTALYRAKSEGRGCFRFFEAGMDAQAQERILLQMELRRAIQEEKIEPHFQPLVDLQSGRIVGFEVLARWLHPVHGQVPPNVFIGMAEDIGLIAPLTESILGQACRLARLWPASLTIAVNLSPLHLADASMPGAVRRILAETGFPPGRLELELTESALIGNFEYAEAVLLTLKAQGIRLSLDDFGTGYSSLSHLRALPFDKIKIDASFISLMADQPESRKIVAAVVGLGQSLGLPTLAEGIEQADQAEILRGMGCRNGQGWLFGRAMPAAEVEILLRAAEGGERRLRVG